MEFWTSRSAYISGTAYFNSAYMTGLMGMQVCENSLPAYKKLFITLLFTFFWKVFLNFYIEKSRLIQCGSPGSKFFTSIKLRWGGVLVDNDAC